MKKALALLLSVIICLSVCSCSVHESTGVSPELNVNTVTDEAIAHNIQENAPSKGTFLNPDYMSSEAVSSEQSSEAPAERKEPAVSREPISSSEPDKTIASAEQKPVSSSDPVSSAGLGSSAKPESSSAPVVSNPPAVNEQSGNGVVTQAALDKIHNGFLRLVNEERAKHGLRALTVNSHLKAVAQTRSAETVVSYSHTRPDGSKFYTLVNVKKYDYTSLAENIGQACHAGLSYSSTDKFTGSEEQITAIYTNMFASFKASAPHYATIINGKYAHTGVGITCQPDKDNGVPIFYFAQLFGNT